MKDLPLISIIIPVYNSKAFLERCLDSVCGQTYHNLEIILVNDGSADESEEICRHYSGMDERIRLINQENQGSAAARNTGLRHAQGEMIGFVDSDDQIRPEMYEELFRAQNGTGADITLCDVESGGKPEHPDWTNDTFDGTGAIFSEFIKGRIINRVYNKLYRAEIVREVDFPAGRNMMEDASWTPQVLVRANRVTRIEKPLYIYTDNERGLTRSKSSHTKICSRFANLLDRESICLRNAGNEDDRRMAAGELIRYIRQMMESTDDLDLFEIRRTLKETVEEHYRVLEQAAVDKEEKTMLEAIRQGNLANARRQYRRAVWLYGHSARDRLRLLLRLIGS